MTTSFNLNDEINNIMDSNMSMADKNAALLKIGLRPRDLSLLGFKARAKRTTSLKIGHYTFGVEIECVNAPQYDLVQAVLTEGVDIAFEGYNHDTRKHFKLVTDSSLCGCNTIECVSPVLSTKKDENDLKKVCKALSAIGATVNSSCGLHVHIGAKDITNEWYVRIFKNYQACEAVIDSFMAQSRRNSRWCRPLRGFNFDGCYGRVDVANTMYNDRYYKVNPVSYRRHNTIEFRQHQGTTNYKKIIMWVQFLKELVDFSKENVIANQPTSVDDLSFISDGVKTYLKGRVNDLA